MFYPLFELKFDTRVPKSTSKPNLSLVRLKLGKLEFLQLVSRAPEIIFIDKEITGPVMSQSIPTGYIPPGQPPGISSKTLPGGSGFDF